jgi:hypothetical protein
LNHQLDQHLLDPVEPLVEGSLRNVGAHSVASSWSEVSRNSIPPG